MKIYRTLPLLLAFVVMPICQPLWALDLYNYCSVNNEQTDEAFLNQFPYLEYLKEFSIKNLNVLEEHRQYLSENGRDGDNFLFNLCETYLEVHPVDPTDLQDTKEKIKIGETFLRLDGVLSSVYPAMGDFLLSMVAEAVQEGIQNEQLNPRQFDVKYLVERLEDNLYVIDIPLSNKAKFLLHAKKGNWGYIWSRVRARYLEEFILLLTIGIFVGGFTARFLLKRISNKSPVQKQVEI